MNDPFGDKVDPAIKAMRRAAMRRDDAALRNDTIEECARVAEGMESDSDYFKTATAVAAAIRALKDKPHG